MKKLLLALLFVAVLAVFANDGGRLFFAHNKLRADTRTLAAWAADNGGRLPRDEVAAKLVEQADLLDLRVTQYGQDENGIQIWTASDVSGLWVIGTYTATLDGTPLKTAWGHPITITEHSAAQFR